MGQKVGSAQPKLLGFLACETSVELVEVDLVNVSM